MDQIWIMHVDMDAFFASIEQLDTPAWRGKPLVVGGGGNRGVVSAASYEARVFGVHSAMPMMQAKNLCPQAIVVKGRMGRYAEVSRQVQEVLRQFSPTVEQASIDEAYLDATGLERLFGPVESMAMTLKTAVTKATGGLHCSVGLAPVKFLAKIASDKNKPDGLFVLYPHEVQAFLQPLPVQTIPGVGKAFKRALADLGIHTCGQVLGYSRPFWERRFGKSGVLLFDRAQGIDFRQVEPVSPPKSESAETTFAHDTLDMDFLRQWLFKHADRVGRSLRQHHLKGRVVTLKIKYADFKQISRQVSLVEPTCATQTLFETGCQLLASVNLEQKVRLIGLGVSGFGQAPPYQLSLGVPGMPSPHAAPGMVSPEDAGRRARLDSTLDTLRARFGREAVMPGRLFCGETKKEEKEHEE